MNAYLVRVNHFLVFVEADPRCMGCAFPVEPEIRLDELDTADAVQDRTAAELCVGVDPADNHHFCVFRSATRTSRAGFRQVIGMPVVVPSWAEFLQVAAECGELID